MLPFRLSALLGGLLLLLPWKPLGEILLRWLESVRVSLLRSIGSSQALEPVSVALELLAPSANKWVLAEFSYLHLAWTSVQMLSTVISIVSFTTRLSFFDLTVRTPFSGGWLLDTGCDLLFITEIFVRRRTAYRDPELQKMVVDTETLAKKYREDWLACDVLSILDFPLELVVSILCARSPAASLRRRPLGVLRAPRMLRLVHLLSYFNVWEEFSTLSNNHFFTPNFLKLVS